MTMREPATLALSGSDPRVGRHPVHRFVHAVATVVVLTAAFPVPRALAVTDAIAITGTGSIDPGLPCAPSCTIRMDFTAVLSGPDVVRTSSCVFNGYDTYPGGATLTQGSGFGAISCDGDIPISGSMSYSRSGPTMSMTGTVTVGESVGVPIEMTLGFVPTSVSPITSFSFSGGGTTNGAAGDSPAYLVTPEAGATCTTAAGSAAPCGPCTGTRGVENTLWTQGYGGAWDVLTRVRVTLWFQYGCPEGAPRIQAFGGTCEKASWSGWRQMKCDGSRGAMSDGSVRGAVEGQFRCPALNPFCVTQEFRHSLIPGIEGSNSGAAACTYDVAGYRPPDGVSDGYRECRWL